MPGCCKTTLDNRLQAAAKRFTCTHVATPHMHVKDKCTQNRIDVAKIRASLTSYSCRCSYLYKTYPGQQMLPLARSYSSFMVTSLQTKKDRQEHLFTAPQEFSGFQHAVRSATTASQRRRQTLTCIGTRAAPKWIS